MPCVWGGRGGWAFVRVEPTLKEDRTITTASQSISVDSLQSSAELNCQHSRVLECMNQAHLEQAAVLDIPVHRTELTQ